MANQNAAISRLLPSSSCKITRMKPSPLKPLKTKIGHATMKSARTGCTVLLFDSPSVCGVHTAGGAPGTRETDLLDPTCMVEKVNAIFLTGGSAFGLAGADGVMKYLAERKIGYKVGGDRVPIVPAAVIYDRQVGKPAAPGPKEGYKACLDADYSLPSRRNIGAGCGATVGKFSIKLKPQSAGLGAIVTKFTGNISVAAVVVVNAYGNVINPKDGSVIAGATDARNNKIPFSRAKTREMPMANTTIGAIITNARLTKAQAKRVAMAAHDGLAKTIDPSHTLYDGDTLFAISTGNAKADPNLLGIRAAQTTAEAVLKAVGG